MLERKRLQVELFGVDGQLRTFAHIRERHVADGKDPSAFYRQLQARREKLLAALGQPRSEPGPTQAAGPRVQAVRPDQPLRIRPVSPPRFEPKLGGFHFGSSGTVQLAPASEGTNVVPKGPFPHTGEIVTIPGSDPGAVVFGGEITVGPAEVPPDGYNPSLGYVWLQHWNYLIPFPPPPGLSRLTYRFEVFAFINLTFGGGAGEVLSFVELGETPQLMTGTNVTVDIDGASPLVADLAQPAPYYNCHYGSLTGQAVVERSFMVGAGHVPGVAVAVGAAVALPMMSKVALFFAGTGYSGINIFSQNLLGRVEYSYEPQLVAEQAE
jgi:hypothetical protein